MFNSWTDETVALKQELAASDNITARQLAVSLGISTRDMQDRIAMLCFPKRMLQLINEEVLPWTVARQALVFVGKEHQHRTELAALSRRLGVLARSPYFSGRLTSMQVTRKIYEVLFHGRRAAHWQQFNEAMRFGDVTKERPLFDVAAFKKQHRQTLHTVPKLWRSGKSRVFTCAGKDWTAAQKNALSAVSRTSVCSPCELSSAPDVTADAFDGGETFNTTVHETCATQVRPIRRCTAGLPNDWTPHWHIQWQDEWGSEEWINESPAFMETALDEMQSFLAEYNLQEWWLVWHEYTRPNVRMP